MSAETLLPGNATPIEEEIALTWAGLDAIDPLVIETLWDAWRCPAALLPWLGWGVSVDLWDDGWDEIRKRQAIADAPAYHRIKGTARAVEMAIALMSSGRLVEWFEEVPPGRRGTATAFVEWADPTATIGAIRARAMLLANTAKGKARAIAVQVGVSAAAAVTINGGFATSTLLAVSPMPATMPATSGPAPIAAGFATSTLLTIQPGA